MKKFTLLLFLYGCSPCFGGEVAIPEVPIEVVGDAVGEIVESVGNAVGSDVVVESAGNIESPVEEPTVSYSEPVSSGPVVSQGATRTHTGPLRQAGMTTTYQTQTRQRLVQEEVQVPVQRPTYERDVFGTVEEQVPTQTVSTVMVPETRSRTVQKTRMKSETRTRKVARTVYEDQEYQVSVPETYTEEQQYTVNVPKQRVSSGTKTVRKTVKIGTEQVAAPQPVAAPQVACVECEPVRQVVAAPRSECVDCVPAAPVVRRQVVRQTVVQAPRPVQYVALASPVAAPQTATVERRRLRLQSPFRREVTQEQVAIQPVVASAPRQPLLARQLRAARAPRPVRSRKAGCQ